MPCNSALARWKTGSISASACSKAFECRMDHANLKRGLRSYGLCPVNTARGASSAQRPGLLEELQHDNCVKLQPHKAVPKLLSFKKSCCYAGGQNALVLTISLPLNALEAGTGSVTTSRPHSVERPCSTVC